MSASDPYEVILSHFKLFDQDGDGTINRHELGQVLRSLNRDAWSEKRLDRLLAAADTNKDGRISFVEFLSWVFRDGRDQRAFRSAMQRFDADGGNGVSEPAKGSPAASDARAPEAETAAAPSAPEALPRSPAPEAPALLLATPKAPLAPTSAPTSSAPKSRVPSPGNVTPELSARSPIPPMAAHPTPAARAAGSAFADAGTASPVEQAPAQAAAGKNARQAKLGADNAPASLELSSDRRLGRCPSAGAPCRRRPNRLEPLVHGCGGSTGNLLSGGGGATSSSAVAGPSTSSFSLATASPQRCRSAGSLASVSPSSKVDTKLQEEAKSKVRTLFQRYTRGRWEGLRLSDFQELAVDLAAELNVDVHQFPDHSLLFHRFDVDGDGAIDEKETVMLAESLLRHCRDALHPRALGETNMLNIDYQILEDDYILGEKLGMGGQGVVYKAKERFSGQDRVVKFYDKGNANAPLDEIKDEFQLLRSLDHPRIQRLHNIFEDRSNVYVVSEPYLGGHLGQMVDAAMDNSIWVTTQWLAKVMHQVLHGVAYLHSKYVIHCDLKESNIMVVDNDNWKDPSIVVIDFGLARNFVVAGSGGGTNGYLPPEVWSDGLWTPKGDVHALGVITYQLFTDARCFPGRDDATCMEATLNTMPDFDLITKRWKRCFDLRPLLEAMLHKDFRKRPTVKESMKHDFYMNRVGQQDWQEDPISPSLKSTLSSLSSTNEIQRAILTDFATRVNLSDLRELNAAFTAMDLDNDGVITAEEARASLSDRVDDPAEIERMVDTLLGGDGVVLYTTFMGRLLAAKAADENHLLWREFQVLDTQRTGYLGVAEIQLLLDRPALKPIIGGRGVSEVLAMMDADRDKLVSFEEFKRALGGEAMNLGTETDPPKRASVTEKSPEKGTSPPSMPVAATGS